MSADPRESLQAVTLDQALAAVGNMASLSEAICKKVDGLCRVALHALKTPAGQRDAESLAQLLRTIIHAIGETADCIEWEAEKVGVMLPTDAEVQNQVANVLVPAVGEGVRHG